MKLRGAGRRAVSPETNWSCRGLTGLLLRCPAAPLIGPHQCSLSQDVIGHGVLRLCPGDPVGKGEHDVQSIEAEVIPMRLSRRRTRPTVADLARVVSALAGSGGELRKAGHPAGQLHRPPRQIVQDPMHPGAPGCVRIVTDYNQASALDRTSLPGQGGGEISPSQLWIRGMLPPWLKSAEVSWIGADASAMA